MNDMRWKTIRFLVLLVSLGTTILAGDEVFFGETPLRALCDRSDAIVTGAISWGDIGITHGGMTRTPLIVRVTDVLKGAVTNSEIGVLVVTYMGTSPRRDLTNGCSCVLFLTSTFQTVDSWFSIQPADRNLLWALKEICKNTKQERPTTAPTLPAYAQDHWQGVLGVEVHDVFCTGTVQSVFSSFQHKWQDAAGGQRVPSVDLLVSSKDVRPELKLQIQHLQAKEILDIFASTCGLEYTVQNNAIVFRRQPLVVGGEIVREVLPMTTDAGSRLNLTNSDVNNHATTERSLRQYGVAFHNGEGAVYQPSAGGLVVWAQSEELAKAGFLVWLANHGFTIRKDQGQQGAAPLPRAPFGHSEGAR